MLQQVFICASIIPPKNNIKADSGASRHYFRLIDQHLLQNLTTVENVPPVTLPDSTYILAIKVGYLPHKTLSNNAQKVCTFQY